MLYYVFMAALGFLYLVLIFALCFALVHIFKLAAEGFKSIKAKPEPKSEDKQEQNPKPVYYIVEKKRERKKYSAPREIEFK